MSHPDPRNDPDNTYPVRKFGTGKPVHFQGKTGIPKHKLRADGGLEKPIKKMLSLSEAFPGESRMDKVKARLGSDSNYKNRSRVVSAYKSLTRHDNAKTKALKGKAGELHKRASFTQKSVPFGYGGVDHYKSGEQKYRKGDEPLGHKFGK